MSDWETPRTIQPSVQMATGENADITLRVSTSSHVPSSRNVSPCLIKTMPSPSLSQFPGTQLTIRSKPKVACINPTPQIEVGTLSPLISPSTRTNTPRIPLAELSQSNLSQRLFHSPAGQAETSVQPQPSQLTPVSVSPISLQSNISSSSKLLHTQVSPSSPALSLSPSNNLLHTQLPASSRVGRERRHQINTEIQLVALKQQVEQLGTMLCNKQLNDVNNSSMALYQQQVEQLEQEREELERMLDEREHQLATFKNSLATLNVEYMSDLASVRKDAQELTEQVKEREEKYSNLEREHKKSLKTIHGLQAYIRTLPTNEEVIDLKSKLEARTDELAESGVKCTELENVTETLRDEQSENEKKIFELEIEKKELLERNKELQKNVSEGEKRMHKARDLGEDQVELLIFDKNELEHENQKLNNLLEWKCNKFEDEKHKLEEQVKRLGGLLEQTNKQLQVTNSNFRQTNASKGSLEVELKKKTEANTTLIAKLDKFGAEIQNLRSNNESTARLDGHYTRLTRGMRMCIAELSSLHELCNQVLSGGDPNMSILLGVREVGVTFSSLDKDTINLTIEEKLDLVRSQLEEVSRVQGEVKELRSRIADKYAEKLADNMTSCVTQ